MADKTTIEKNFTRYASTYDQFAVIQNRIAQKLLDFTDSQNYSLILDIGCGTGNYTSLLNKKFPAAKITALDISEKMISVAKKKLSDSSVDFLIADAESARIEKKFDLLTSNACFQWFDDLDNMLEKCAKLLTPNGTISFSIFGPQTFHRLKASLTSLFDQPTPVSSADFLSIDALNSSLAKHFKNHSIEEQLIEEKYDSLWHLLNTIKHTGTRGSGINGQKLSRSHLAELENIYKQKFDSIIATYQIFYCKAKAKD